MWFHCKIIIFFQAERSCLHSKIIRWQWSEASYIVVTCSLNYITASYYSIINPNTYSKRFCLHLWNLQASQAYSSAFERVSVYFTFFNFSSFQFWLIKFWSTSVCFFLGGWQYKYQSSSAFCFIAHFSQFSTLSF